MGNIEDKRPIRFARIGYEILENPEITSKDIAVYVALARFADFNDGSCYPGEKKICSIAKIGNLRTLRDSLARLCKLGFLTIVAKPGETNSYTLTTPGAKVPQVVESELPGVGGAKLPYKREPSEREPVNQKKVAPQPAPVVNLLKEAVKELLASWNDTHIKAFNFPAMIMGGRDWKMLESATRKYGKDLMLAMMQEYWKWNVERERAVTIPDFVSKIQKLFFVVRQKGGANGKG